MPKHFSCRQTSILDSNLDVISVIKCFKSSKQVTDWNSKAIFVQIIMHSTESWSPLTTKRIGLGRGVKWMEALFLQKCHFAAVLIKF